MSQRKCDSCLMLVNACPALKKKIDPALFAMREELCELNYEDKTKKDAGFTIIELMVAVAIILIIASIGVGSCGEMFFQKKFTGKVTQNTAIGSGNAGFMGMVSKDARELAFSRGINIITDEGEDIIFSTIDRQFSVIQIGDRVKIKVFQYPPWDFTKAGTYYNGRLLRKLK